MTESDASLVKDAWRLTRSESDCHWVNKYRDDLEAASADNFEFAAQAARVELKQFIARRRVIPKERGQWTQD